MSELAGGAGFIQLVRTQERNRKHREYDDHFAG
jgi:hypothetical protein